MNQKLCSKIGPYFFTIRKRNKNIHKHRIDCEVFILTSRLMYHTFTYIKSGVMLYGRNCIHAHLHSCLYYLNY